MNRCLSFAAGLVLASTLVPGAAQAQNRAPPTCEPSFDGDLIFNTPAMACARSTVNRLLLLNQIDVIRRVTAVSFGVGPSTIEAAGLADLTPEEAAARLDEDLVQASPAAEVAATPAASRFNLWVDGKYTYNDSSLAAFDLDGPLHNLMAGLDVKLGDKVTLGVMGSYEHSHFEGVSAILPPELTAEGWGVGPYFGVTLTPNLIWSGNFLYTAVTSNQNDLLHYESDRYQAATALTGYFYHGTWRFSPSLSLSWSREIQTETTGLVADETIETATISPSLQVGKTLKLGDRATVEPWLGGAFDYTYLNRIDDAVLGLILDDPTTDLRLQAGLNFALGSRAQLALTGEMGGLLLENSNTYSAEANFSLQF